MSKAAAIKAAQAAAKKKGKGRKGRRGGARGGTLIWVMLGIMGAAASTIAPTALLFVVGMVPTMVAFIIDRDPEGVLPFTVGAPNFAAFSIYMIQLWQSGHSVSNAASILSDPFALAVMYGAAGVGWGLYVVIPGFVSGVRVAQAERLLKAMEVQRGELEKAWGPALKAKG